MDRVTGAGVLLETVARGSISAAAAELGMSRAMASRYIAMMEDWAGARLLHRTTRTLSLTAAGENVLPACRTLAKAAGDIPVLGAAANGVIGGSLRVTAPSIVAEYFLTDAIAAFLATYPDVSIELQVVDRMVSLAEDGIDLAIRVTKALDAEVIARRLADVTSVICASPSYLAARGAPAGMADFGAHDCVTYSFYGQDMWSGEMEGTPCAVPVSGRFRTNEAAVVVRAALAGAGIALLPRFAVVDALTDGRLVRLMPSARMEVLGLFALYLSRRHMPGALRLLIDFLATRLREQGSRWQ